VVVEDAPAGISAGRAAGARVIAVTTTHDADEVADADVIVTDLSCVRLEFTDDKVVIVI
jgi:sugar-phosphatase